MTRCGACFNLVVHSAQRLCRHTDDTQLSHIERVDEAYREPTTDVGPYSHQTCSYQLGANSYNPQFISAT